jgi:hypothetical protein
MRTLAVIAALPLAFIGGGWVTDDFAHVVRLAQISSPWPTLSEADAFGFYRPTVQISLWLQAELHGFLPPLFRAVNVLLHVAVCALAFAVGRRLLTPRAALFATLAFVLAPKTPAIVTLWASARPELLMSVFALSAAWAWLRWHERGTHNWIALAAACYVLAFLSKESAALLPVTLLVMTPSSSRVTPQQRRAAVSALLAFALIPIALRLSAGALMPAAGDGHYDLDFSLYRLMRSLQVYLPRALPAPLALLMLVALPAILAARSAPFVRWWQTTEFRRIALIAGVWFLTLMLPVLPIVARSELYLYLPGLGFCFLAGYVTDLAVPAARTRTALFRILVAAYVIAFLGYQQVRNVRAHRIQVFTGALVDAVRGDTRLRSLEGQVRFTAADAASEALMRDGVGGYINGVTAIALPGNRFASTVAYAGAPPIENTQPVTYRFIDGRVTLTH